MTETTRGFCWHQNFVPWGCLPLTCGYIHLLNHEKMCIKSEVEEILFKLATNYHSDEAFLLTSKFLALMGCLPLAIWLCLNFFSAITADLNISSQGSDTGPMVLWFLTSSAVWALSVFFKWNAIEMYRQWVPCGPNSCYSFLLIVLKLRRCFLHGMKMCM